MPSFLDDEKKQRAYRVVSVAKTVFHWGIIPFILYLGVKRGQTDPNLPPFDWSNVLLWS